MATVSLLLSCLSLLICNKVEGPAVTLIELWDHISPTPKSLTGCLWLCVVALIPINKLCVHVRHRAISKPAQAWVDLNMSMSFETNECRFKMIYYVKE